MVRFIHGKASLDISAGVRGEITKLLKKDKAERKIIYIVPDQFEAETESAVYDILKKEGLLCKFDLIKITTFSALAEMLFSENKDNRPCADDIVKGVVMHKAAAELGDSLRLLKRISHKQGFCEKMAETINSFKSSGLGADELIKRTSSAAGELPAGVLDKLLDVSDIYKRYDDILKEKKYIDRLDMIGIASEYVGNSALFDGADVFVDCFNDFTNDQMRFLGEMIQSRTNITFGFVTDRDSDCDVFRTANSRIAALEKFAGGADKTESIQTELSPRYINTKLEKIPERLFQDTVPTFSVRSVTEKSEPCELITAPKIYDELDFVCAKIQQLVETTDMRYRDIAVLCTDLSGSGRYLESAFNKYNIPFFLDKRESIINRPLIKAVLTVINAVCTFSIDSVLSCIKTGFYAVYNDKKDKTAGLTEHEIGVFEDYIFEWALTTRHLEKPFTFTANPDRIDSRTATAENIRKKIAVPLFELHKKLRNKKTDGAKLTELIYDYLINKMNIMVRINAKCQEPETDEDSSALYTRLWNTLIKIFNALHKELDGIEVTARDYYDIFRDVCLSTTLSNPPQMADRLLVGDIDRTRADKIKAAFIVGATFDSFPAPMPAMGIFSQYETDLIHSFLKKSDTDNSVSDAYLKFSKEQYCLALYRAYRAVTLPTEYLCISFSENTPSGDPMQISSVSENINKIFALKICKILNSPSLKRRRTKSGKPCKLAENTKSVLKRTSDFSDEFYCRSVSAAKFRFACGMGSRSRENKLLKNALLAQKKEDCADYVERMETLMTERTSLNEDIIKHKIAPDTASLLFPREFGATNTERIAECKFKFFCEYGLKIRERQQRTFTSSKRGDAIHYVLENVLKYFSGNIKDFCSLKRGQLFSVSKHFLEEYCRIATNNSPLSDNRVHFLFGNIANIATDTLISMQMEFNSRKYRPKFFELNLNPPSAVTVYNNEQPFPPAPLDVKLFESAEAFPDQTASKLNPMLEIDVKPLKLTLADGKDVFIHGKIDRVDMFEENQRIYVRAVDYKTAPHSFELDLAKKGINIQMLLYLSALLDANPGKNLAAGGISYIPTKNRGAIETETDPFGLIAMNHLSSGLLVLDSVTENDYENYKKYIVENTPNALRKDGSNEYEKFIEYRAVSDEGHNCTKSVESDKFSDLQSMILGGVKDRFGELFNGDVYAKPRIYVKKEFNFSAKKTKFETKTNNPCEYCGYKSICKINDRLEKKFADENKKETASDDTADIDNDEE